MTLKIANLAVHPNLGAADVGVDATVVYPPTPLAPCVTCERSPHPQHRPFRVRWSCEVPVGTGRAFKGLLPKEWHYVTAAPWGRCCRSGLPVEVRAAALSTTSGWPQTLDRLRWSDLYGRASLFWHAAGLGSADASPESSETRRISTVEAMTPGRPL